jgi:hypothetical protein
MGPTSLGRFGDDCIGASRRDGDDQFTKPI